MIRGPFSLADATDAEMTYRLWLNSQPEYDRIWWWGSTDGHHFCGFWWSENTGGWVEATLDLTDVYELGDVRGESQAWVAFTFSSDSSVHQAEGATIDDIVVRKVVGGVSAPATDSRHQADSRRGTRSMWASTADWVRSSPASIRTRTSIPLVPTPLECNRLRPPQHRTPPRVRDRRTAIGPTASPDRLIAVG